MGRMDKLSCLKLDVIGKVVRLNVNDRNNSVSLITLRQQFDLFLLVVFSLKKKKTPNRLMTHLDTTVRNNRPSRSICKVVWPRSIRRSVLHCSTGYRRRNSHLKQGRIHGIRCVLARTGSSFGPKRLFCIVSTRA